MWIALHHEIFDFEERKNINILPFTMAFSKKSNRRYNQQIKMKLGYDLDNIIIYNMTGTFFFSQRNA